MSGVADVRDDWVLRVYSGRRGCMCGCRGTYRVAARHRAEADAERGYPHDDAELEALR